MPHIPRPDGSPIHYRLEGPDGAPVLMLSNSLGVALGMWENQRGAFSGLRLLRYDTRGHGGSGARAVEYSLADLGHDALALLDALGIDRAAFCGISMGGAIGQWLAINAPNRLTRLILSNTAATFGAPEAWTQRIETARTLGMAALTPVVLERWFTPEFRAREPAAVQRIEAMLLACPPAGYAGCCAALRDTDLTADLGRIATPTLVIGGTRDPSTPPALAEALAAAIKGARLTLLEAAHLSNIEQADAFNSAVAGFLD